MMVISLRCRLMEVVTGDNNNNNIALRLLLPIRVTMMVEGGLVVEEVVAVAVDVSTTMEVVSTTTMEVVEGEEAQDHRFLHKDNDGVAEEDVGRHGIAVAAAIINDNKLALHVLEPILWWVADHVD